MDCSELARRSIKWSAKAIKPIPHHHHPRGKTSAGRRYRASTDRIALAVELQASAPSGSYRANNSGMIRGGNELARSAASRQRFDEPTWLDRLAVPLRSPPRTVRIMPADVPTHHAFPAADAAE